MATSQSLHLTAMNAPGLLAGSGVQPDSRHLQCGFTGRTGLAYPYPSGLDCRLHSNVKTGAIKFASEIAKFVCKARRKSEFPNQSGHGFDSQNRNKRNEWEEIVENVEEVDVLSYKNGPVLSQSSNQKFQPTATPGPREKEVVELFRKVQAQLRQRAANKKEKKFEAEKKQGNMSDAMNSIFQILRKHTGDESKRNSDSDKGKHSLKDEKENVQQKREPRSNPFGRESSLKDESQRAKLASVSRPASNFQRRSPVTRAKCRPIPSIDEETIDTISTHTGDGKIEKNEDQTTDDFDAHPVSNSIVEVDTENYELVHPRGLSTLKLSELREIAKCRGLRGISKMKKSDLLELLSESSV